MWAALIEPGQLDQWAPFVAGRALDVTGPVTLTHIDGDEVDDLPGAVLQVTPPSVLEYTWDHDVLRWELEPHEHGTRLTLRHTVTDPAVLPDVTAGWHLGLDVGDHLLAGRPVGAIRGRDAMDHGWQQLRDEYALRLETADGIAPLASQADTPTNPVESPNTDR